MEVADSALRVVHALGLGVCSVHVHLERVLVLVTSPAQGTNIVNVRVNVDLDPVPGGTSFATEKLGTLGADQAGGGLKKFAATAFQGLWKKSSKKPHWSRKISTSKRKT